MEQTLIIVLLILLNGLFVAAEFALIGVPHAAMERRAAAGSRGALRVLKVLRNPRAQDRYIATAQLGITFASLGLGMYGEHSLAVWLHARLAEWGYASWPAAHAVSSIVSITILTYFHIVIGEMVPKSLALRYSERLSMLILIPMHWIKMGMYPLVVGLNATGNFLLRLMGVDRDSSKTFYHTSEELQYIIEESHEGGLLQQEAGRVLRDLFEFEDMEAHEVMTPRVHIKGLPYGASADEVRVEILASRHSRYPVYKGDLDHMVGMIHVRDIFLMLARNESLTEAYIRPLPFVPKTIKLDNVLEVLRRAHTHMAIVMDEHGGTSGLLTKEDLLEEVVDSLEEEGHAENGKAGEVSPSLCVPGTQRLSEVGEEFGLKWEDDAVDTVSGLVLMKLERPPLVGDEVEYRGFRFEVLAVKDRGVAECRISPPAEEAEIGDERAI